MNIPAISDDFRFVLWIYIAISSAISVVLLAYTGNYLNFLIRHKVKGEHPGGRVPGKPGIITWTWLLISLIGAGVCTAIASSAPESIGGNDRTVLPTFINSIALILAGFLALSLKINKRVSYVLLGLFVISGAVVGIKNYKEYQRIQQKTVILVMTIDGPDEEYRFTEILFSELHAEFDNYEDVLVIYSEQTIGEEQREYARAFGKKQLADVMLWGWYSATQTDALVKIHVENLNEGLFEDLSVGDQYESQSPVSMLDSFELQQSSSDALIGSVLFLSGYVRYLEQDYSEAISRFQRALGFSVWAENIVNKNSALFVLATAQMLQGDNQNALITFNELISSDSTQAMALLNRSSVLNKLGDNEKALEDNNNAILIILEDEKKNKPKYHNKFLLYNNRGIIHLDRGEIELAILDFTTSIDLSLNQEVPYYNRGNAYLQKGDYDLAIQDYTTATTIDSAHWAAYHNRGVAYSNTGNFKKAIKDFTIAIKLLEDLLKSNDSKELKNILAAFYINRASSYARNKEFELALNDCEKSLVYNSAYPAAHATKGIIYMENDMFLQARKELDNAIALDSSQAIFYYNRGIALANLSEFDLAKSDFEKCIELTEDPYVKNLAEEYLKIVSDP